MVSCTTVLMDPVRGEPAFVLLRGPEEGRRRLGTASPALHAGPLGLAAIGDQFSSFSEVGRGGGAHMRSVGSSADPERFDISAYSDLDAQEVRYSFRNDCTQSDLGRRSDASRPSSFATDFSGLAAQASRGDDFFTEDVGDSMSVHSVSSYDARLSEAASYTGGNSSFRGWCRESRPVDYRGVGGAATPTLRTEGLRHGWPDTALEDCGERLTECSRRSFSPPGTPGSQRASFQRDTPARVSFGGESRASFAEGAPGRGSSARHSWRTFSSMGEPALDHVEGAVWLLGARAEAPRPSGAAPRPLPAAEAPPSLRAGPDVGRSWTSAWPAGLEGGLGRGSFSAGAVEPGAEPGTRGLQAEMSLLEELPGFCYLKPGGRAAPEFSTLPPPKAVLPQVPSWPAPAPGKWPMQEGSAGHLPPDPSSSAIYVSRRLARNSPTLTGLIGSEPEQQAQGTSPLFARGTPLAAPPLVAAPWHSALPRSAVGDSDHAPLQGHASAVPASGPASDGGVSYASKRGAKAKARGISNVMRPAPVGSMRTLMVRNIPVRYTQDMLLKEWPNHGSYDFLYLPICIDRKRNGSFCFINFVSEALADEFRARWQKQRLEHYSARKPLDISPAAVQGRDENLMQIVKNKTCRLKNPHFQPAIFNGPERISMEEFLLSLGVAPKGNEPQSQQG